jgi:hypothetical protein
MKIDRTSLQALAAVVAMGLLLTGCTSAAHAASAHAATVSHPQWVSANPVDPASPGLTFKDLGQAGESYTETVTTFPSSLPLPPGQSFPTALPTSWDPSVTVDNSWGESVAYFYWRCSWSHDFLTAYAAHNAPEQDVAIGQLEKWTTTSYFREYVMEDPDAGWQQELIDPAKRGDVTMMKDFDQSDCTYYRQINGG